MKKNVLKISKYFVLLIGVLYLGGSCSADKEDVTKIPTPLILTKVENIAGGAQFFYDLPQDDDVILITAEYPTDNGGTQILRFDIEGHKSFLTLTNLSTLKRKVELYTVNKYGNRSTGVETEIEPLLSPKVIYLNNILETVTVEPALGGVVIKFSNNNEGKEVLFNISYKDDNNQWKELANKPTSSEHAASIMIDAPYSEFSIYLQDQSNEKSETKQYAIIPIVEVKLDKSLWTEFMLPTDCEANYASLPLKNLWDEVRLVSTGRFESKPAPFPQSFTIDLGVSKNLSKIKIYAYAAFSAHTYGNYNPRIIEVYGSTNPATDGSWESWEKLANCVSIKPSGSEFGKVTDEDYEYIKQGELYKLTLTDIPYRYIRLKVLETWGIVTPQGIRLDELELWEYND